MNKKIYLPSDKKFGLFFCVICFIFYLYTYFSNTFIRFNFILLFLSLTFLLFSFYKSIYLRPLNLGWYYIGILLGKVANPIILGVMFYFLLTPISIMLKIFRRDELEINTNLKLSSWKNYKKKKYNLDYFKNQF